MTVEIAAAAVATLVPYLTTLAESATERLGEKAADGSTKLLAWLRMKLTGRAQEALDDIEADPQSADNQADLRKQISKQLEAEPGLRGELETLLAGSAASNETMIQNISGANTVGNQIRGNDNQVTIER